MPKYFLKTYGCQMNKSDSERIAGILEENNYKPASDMKEADLILINSCSIRQSAIDRIWGQTKIISKLKIQNPKIKAVLTGCVLKKDKRKFKERFDLIIDIKELSKLPGFLKNKTSINKHYLKIKPKYETSFRAYIPITTGCNNFCSYCVVPYTRGKEVSRQAKEIICEIESLIKRNYKEIWLLGENVNSFRSGKIDFPKLLEMINNIPGNFWIRFTSPHPKDFSNKLINTIAQSKKATEYIHLPVQSGDDKILKKMKRPYTLKMYKDLVKRIRKSIPKMALSTDIIVGFPGETIKQFENTIKLFKEIKFDMAYISQYSARLGTLSSKMEDNVSHKEKERRDLVLTKVLSKTALKNNKEYIGKKIEVLIEQKKKTFLMGKTRSYKSIRFKGNKNLIGKFVKVKILGALPWGLKGELIK
ncbi:MAG TPA: tRNA (N6-isopentenyl adenosine(37)-C2)-methylthiotransferase MiaB [Candidatus Parcubacteria bacterium]|jgi:tRNA-2-methylthio-N6-dimethylallyladenosine synthase|nr:tRNA (N6-isopentenyl adenosine(37)-C2)-methylthiotransferase MiaB [Parcubacteria group bacterium]HJN62316.1 tRNA (N6-isopentenyl adenosine(37)-C2)-methylthiotransferase MiaB [Candidatus Parcubacteria bacterium]|tara:strand:+ start:44365 stop:45618 length:1254 start_codon:yes stop_codon:yes gene_type:complete